MNVSGKTHEVRLWFNDGDVKSQSIGLLVKKSGKNKKSFVLKTESLASFGNTAFSKNEAGLTAKH